MPEVLDEEFNIIPLLQALSCLYNPVELLIGTYEQACCKTIHTKFPGHPGCLLETDLITVGTTTLLPVGDLPYEFPEPIIINILNIELPGFLQFPECIKPCTVFSEGVDVRIVP